MVNKESSWPDWKYPSWRESVKGLTVEGWLEGRREADGAEGLWRVHDDLYDLSSWVHSHPGGAEWLVNTKVAFLLHVLRTFSILTYTAHCLSTTASRWIVSEPPKYVLLHYK